MARSKAPGAAAGRGPINPYRRKGERPRPSAVRISAIFKGGICCTKTGKPRGSREQLQGGQLLQPERMERMEREEHVERITAKTPNPVKWGPEG